MLKLLLQELKAPTEKCLNSVSLVIMKSKAKPVSPEERIEMDKKRSHEERILHLLRLIKLSNLVSEAGVKYRKK